MKRMLAGVLCLALLISLCLTGTVMLKAEGTGLLSNFENEVYNGFWWENATYGMLGNTGTPASVEEENGNHYLLMPTGDKNYARYYYNSPVEAGKTYCLRLRYKGNGLGLAYQSCTVGGGLHWLPATTEWTAYQHVFTMADPITVGASYQLIFWNKAGGSDVCIDDVYLTEVVETEGIDFAEGSSLTLAKGEKKPLTLVAKPDGAIISGAVTYQSDNTAAVTVDANGVVTGVSPGVAHVYATADGFTTSCTVTVDRYAPMLLGDFEGTLSSGWTWENASYGIINNASPMSVHTEESGNNCLKLPSTGSVYYRIYLGAPVEAGKTYRVTLKYKGSGGSLYLMSNGVSTGAGAYALTTTDVWTTFTRTFTAKSPTNVNFTLAFRHDGSSGTAYVDDVYLQEVSPFDNLILDGDLESEGLASQWSDYLANAKVSRVTDTVNGGNCWAFSGKAWPYVKELSAMVAGGTYKLSLKVRGNGRSVFYFHTGVENSMKVSGLPAGKSSVSGKYVYIDTTSDTEWTDCAIVFTLQATNANFNVSFGSYTDNATMYMDDISLVALGNAYAQDGLVGGELTMTVDETTDTLLSDVTDKTVTVTVTPKTGYLLVPGSLRYTTSEGITKRILNKDSAVFGEGAGNTFAFEAPNENIRLTADFVSTTDTDFAFGTVGTAVHLNGQGVEDGIRFLNRVQFTSFDDEAQAYTIRYNGETYTLAEAGLLLKRSTLNYSLDLETYDQLTHDAGSDAVKMWGIKAYDATTNTFRAVDYTDSYIDFSIALITSNPDAAFCERLYTARSYVVLEKEGVKTVIYGNERTDSVDTTMARAEGLLSDDETALPDGGITVDPSTPIPEDDLGDADLKILNIGNSWGHNATSYLADVAAANGKTFKCVNLFKSGCSLEQHYNGYKNNLPQYWYELNGVIDWNSAVTLKAALASDDWDIITAYPGPAESATGNYAEFLSGLLAAIRKYCPTAKVYFMQTWAFGDDYAHLTADTGYSRAEMWAKVEPTSKTIATSMNLPIIPAGTAAMTLEDWFEANEPTLSFYQTDDSHADNTWGWYLLALVWYQTLTGEVPNDDFTAFDSAYTDDPVIRAKVHEIAQAAVAAYAG